jgi:hypothetical protein
MLLCMRTTLQIDDDLYRAAKTAAAESGRTLTSVVEDALRIALLKAAPGSQQEPINLPVFSMGGPLPGVDLDDTAALIDIMEVDDDPV